MKHDFSVVGLPIHDVPIFDERQGQDYISYGSDDSYGRYLEFLYFSSSMHSAIVNGVASMIYGEGLDATDRQEEGKQEQWLRLQMLLGSGEKDLLQKLSLDLKLYGQCYVNVIWNRARTEIAELHHLPVHTIRAGVAEPDGSIPLYYYKRDWHKRHKQEKAQVIRAFDEDDRTEASRVLHIKRYAPSFHYYGLPDYVGSVGYIELDHEIQSFHLNNIKNSFMPSMLLSFTNGIPTDEERFEIERKVQEKFQGAQNAGKLLITFNDGTDTTPQFEAITSNGSDGMYEYLSTEVSRKVLSGHRVTSPLLFGVKGDGSGFGNNAEELRDSYSLFHNSVVIPFQNILLDGLEPILNTNGIHLDLYFKSLKPADFIDLEGGSGISPQPDAETPSEAPQNASELESFIAMGEASDLEGYTCIDERKVEYELEEELDARLHEFASVVPGAGGVDADSPEQDNPLFKVRYQYAPLTYDKNDAGDKDVKSREFCVKMVDSAKIYTKEQIEAAGSIAVNPGFGPNGASTYNIWLYKGGPRCHHFWMRKTYLRDGSSISVNEARRLINKLPPDSRDEVRLPVNDPRVARRPVDMPNKGFR